MWLPSPALTFDFTFMLITPLWFWIAVWIESVSVTSFDVRFDSHRSLSFVYGFGSPCGSRPFPSPALTFVLTLITNSPCVMAGRKGRGHFLHLLWLSSLLSWAHLSIHLSRRLSKRIYSDSFACFDLAFHFHRVIPSKFWISFQRFVELHAKTKFLVQPVQHTTVMDHLYWTNNSCLEQIYRWRRT